MPSGDYSERYDTIVIGAGQAGLAVGYHLACRGRDFVVLEANDHLGASWRTRWDTLRLFTPAQLNGLPGWPFPAARWSFPTKDQMADYVTAYAARFDLPVRTGVNIVSLTREDRGFVAESPSRRFEAENVVVATGGFTGPRLPEFAPKLAADIRQLHSSEYRRPGQLLDGQVLVVGAANSGADIALELSSTRTTWLSGRHPGSEPVRPGSLGDRLVTPPFWFAASHLLTVHNRAGRRTRATLKSHGHPLARVKPTDLAAAGVQRLPRTVDVRHGAPVVEGGQVVDIQNVIWCTGYVADFGWIHLPVFGPDGQPMHDRGVVQREPGLYFVGLPFLFALTSSLVGGVGRDAEYIANHIDARVPSRRVSREAAASTPPMPLPGLPRS